MTHSVSLNEFRAHLSDAKDKLSQEKLEILKLYPLDENFSREEYAFAYVRAERLGMRAINRRLAEIAWLPMQLDPRAELMSENRSSMKRWLSSSIPSIPDSDEFGNDFMHALARCALTKGWDDSEFITLGARIANLFRDLSCLIGLIYYSTWLSENNVEKLRISDPTDLNRTAQEISALMQSPEIYKYIRAQEQDDGKRVKAKKKELPKPEKKVRPALRVIHNESFTDPYTPDPVHV